MQGVSAVYPVPIQDVWNYLTDKYCENNQMAYVLTLNGKVNETILRQAVRISLDVEPVLGCCIVENDDSYLWKRREDLDQIEICSIIETSAVAEELQQFIGERYDFMRDCQVKVRVFRAETDTICIKISHACSDAGGFKQYFNLCLSIYQQLFNGREYELKPSLIENRSQEQLLRNPVVADAIQNITEGFEFIDTVALSCSVGENKEQTIVLGRLEAEQFCALKAYVRKNAATVTDVLLTAFSRAIAQIAEVQNNTITVDLSVDLRRYLPDGKAGAVCNLSSMEHIMIDKNLQESFDETLFKVLGETKRMKSSSPGIPAVGFLESLTKLSFKEFYSQFKEIREQTVKSGLSNPWLSNLGYIAQGRVKFGMAEAVDCYMVGPAAFSPTMALGASTYDDTLTLTVNFFQSTICKAAMEQLINNMLDDLCGCCIKKM